MCKYASQILNFNLCSLHMVNHLHSLYLFIVSNIAEKFHVKLPENALLGSKSKGLK